MLKRIVLASPRGFCAGVDRAIEIVRLALSAYGSPVYVYHEIVHNPYVVAELRTKGAIFVNDLSEVPAGARAIYSAHGVSPAVRSEADGRSLRDHRRYLPTGDKGAYRGSTALPRAASTSCLWVTRATTR